MKLYIKFQNGIPIAMDAMYYCCVAAIYTLVGSISSQHSSDGFTRPPVLGISGKKTLRLAIFQ